MRYATERKPQGRKGLTSQEASLFICLKQKVSIMDSPVGELKINTQHWCPQSLSGCNFTLSPYQLWWNNTSYNNKAWQGFALLKEYTNILGNIPISDLPR